MRPFNYYTKHPTLAVGDTVLCLKQTQLHRPGDLFRVDEENYSWLVYAIDGVRYEQVRL